MDVISTDYDNSGGTFQKLAKKTGGKLAVLPLCLSSQMSILYIVENPLFDLEFDRGEAMCYRVPVRSAELRSIGYDVHSQTLEVEISTGGVYRFFNVPLDIYCGLMMAESYETYYREHVKSRYNFRRVAEPAWMEPFGKAD